MGVSATAYSANTDAIHPGSLYPIRAFCRTSGISETRLRMARREGNELPTVKAGRRTYVRGSDGIAWIEAEAQRTAELAAK